jgi:hypothetical protein
MWRVLIVKKFIKFIGIDVISVMSANPFVVTIGKMLGSQKTTV